MPPVEDISVHEKVRKTTQQAGCFDQPRNGIPCRHIGRQFNGVWIPLDECLGCKCEKDEMYIKKARIDIEVESKRFMKADQRC